MSISNDLWVTEVTDLDGTWGIHVTPGPDNQLDIFFEQENTTGQVTTCGLSFPRELVQELRHALTGWLVSAAPTVGAP